LDISFTAIPSERLVQLFNLLAQTRPPVRDLFV
jgi:hypothetical protein